MISEWTYTSHWVDWELEESIANRDKIICMGFNDGPPQLRFPEIVARLQLTVYTWDHEPLGKLINE